MNVLQTMTLGYWALVVPMAVAMALIVLTVVVVQQKYVAQTDRITAISTATDELNADLGIQQGQLRLFGDNAGQVTVAGLRDTEKILAADRDDLLANVEKAGLHFTDLPDLTQKIDSLQSRTQAAIASGAQDDATVSTAVAAADAALAAVADFVPQADEASTKTNNEMWNFVYIAVGIAIGCLVLGSIGGFLMALFLPRRVASKLQHVVGALAATTSEMLAVVAQVAASAVQTATAISEAATTVDEVRQTSLLASQKATAVADESKRAEDVAEAGRRSVADTLEGMGHIQQDMGVVADSVLRMSEQSDSVGQIMETVNTISEQSALLAVNAAIEAAGAGEYGKGFGVVAEEIKNLAGGSKQSVTQVRTILTDVEKATTAAVMATEQSSRTIDLGVSQATESSVAIDALAENVAAAAQSAMQIVASSQQQLVGMDQIAEAMNSIDQAGAQNAAGARQLQEGVQHIEVLSADLSDMVASTNPFGALRRKHLAAGLIGATEQPQTAPGE
jgi:hypothetical protein